MPRENGVEYGHDCSAGKSITVWQSFDGRRFQDFEGITHQHLSNIYYWTHVVNPEWYNESVKHKIKVAIDRKFDGELLEYRPLARFKTEMDTLRKRGWLKEYENETRVVVDGKVIGRVDEYTNPI